MARSAPADQIRNIGIAAHVDAGKTTTVERILSLTGGMGRAGGFLEGGGTPDGPEGDQEREITITAAATACTWRGYRIHLIDTPGQADRTPEVDRSLRVLDGAVAVLSAVEGVEPQAEAIWRQADERGVPRIAFVNKMDCGGADFSRVLEMMRERLGAKPLAMQLPVGAEAGFRGVVDLVARRARLWDREEEGPGGEDGPIPAELHAQAGAARARLLDALAEVDEVFRRGGVAGEDPPEEAVRAGVRRATLACRGVPVLCGSAFRSKGLAALLDAVVDYLPSPTDVPPQVGYDLAGSRGVVRRPDPREPFAALVFKVMTDPYVGPLTFLRVYSGALQAGAYVLNPRRGKRERVGRLLEMRATERREIEALGAGGVGAAVGLKNTVAGDTLCDPGAPVVLELSEPTEPVLSVALEPKTQADREKLAAGLARMASEDPALLARMDEETGRAVLSGGSELHLEILVNRLLREFQVGAQVEGVAVAYRETVSAAAQAEGRFVRQTGGRGHYGHVVLRVEPGDPGEALVFASAASASPVPREYLPAVEKGVAEGLERGPLGGFPVVGVRVTVLGGSWREAESSEVAFQLAASQAVREAVRAAAPVLLEPVMALEVAVPGEFLGDVTAELAARGGAIRGTDRRGGAQVVYADVPLAALLGYGRVLRARTQGRGTFGMRFRQYRRAVDDAGSPAA
ncbi:MAG: elongation factor G [Thermodesulfobacteriota bacterium]